VTPAAGGGAMKFVLPDQDMIDTAKKLRQGDYVSIMYMKSGRDLMAGKFDRYEVKPGEEVPGVFVFVKSGTETVNKRDVTTVTLSKLGVTATLQVPLAKNSEGKMAPKEDLMKVIDALKADDMVEVKAAGNTLQQIKQYTPPQLCEFVKVEKTKVGDAELWSVVVKVDGADETLVIAKKDAALLGKAKGLKAGDLVYCRSNTDDKGAWLLEIHAAPKGTKLPSKGDEKKPTDKKGE
jgi:hypothetical protein